MSEGYAREVLRRSVAQLCQTIGWNGIQSTPLDVLVHVLEKYVRTLGVECARRAELLERTEPNLHDLGLVFRDLNIHIPELSEYVGNVPPAPCPISVDAFPVPKESHLNFLKPGSNEVVTRPMHVHEHLPPVYPEREQATLIADTIEICQNGHESPTYRSASPEISVTDSPEKKDLFKRPPDPLPLPPSKRPRIKLEEEECRTREISSVMMTMSGFLSPAREGKLPEAAVPVMYRNPHTEKHKPSSHHSNLMRVPPFQAQLERGDKKPKKHKLVNGKVTKSKKKDKHRSDSSKSRHDRPDRVPPDLIHRTIVHSPQVPHHNNVMIPGPRPPPPVPTPEILRPVIKQEPLDPDVLDHNPIHRYDNIPIPRKIPISKSPLVPAQASANATRLINPLPTVPPVTVKQEIIEEEEKLASQPDRSKINIFKRITNKSKEDKVLPEMSESSTIKIDSVTQQNVAKSYRTTATDLSAKTSDELLNNNSENLRVGKSRKIGLSTDEVINIDDDDSLDRNLPNIKPDPDGIPTPVPIPVSRLKNLTGHNDLPLVNKPKKEKKHKDKHDKVAEKAARMKRKQEMLIAATTAPPQNVPSPGLKMKPPKVGKQPKNDLLNFSHMPPNFSLFPSGRGLMPGPGLIPNLIPGSDLYAGLASNPALRGLPANLIANPFNPGFIPGPSFMPGPGLVPAGLLGNIKPNKPPPKHAFPILRRPSLEVIPVDSDDTRGHSSLRENDRIEKHKMPTIPNILQKSPQKSRNFKENASKSGTYRMPAVMPDVTIELNPPTIHPEVKSEPPSQPPPLLPELVRASPINEPLPESSVPDIPKEMSKDGEEKKGEKLLKKIKKEKDVLKIKKKKDRKDKNRSEKKKDKEEKSEAKEKIKKERKEKKRDKERPEAVEGLVPKLTLKLGSGSPMPPSSPEPLKLNIKPIKKDPEAIAHTGEEIVRDGSRSPELAQISALVTGPPKNKPSKHNNSTDSTDGRNSPAALPSNLSPQRKNRPPSSHHSKYKRILIKPLTKRSEEEESVELLQGEPAASSRPVDKCAPVQLATPYYTDEHGNKVWVCPACGQPDNGSPMIGCDGCDCWYHWVCVGITEDPGTSEDWFCKSCLAKRAAMITALAGVQTGRKRGRKPKGDKV